MIRKEMIGMIRYNKKFLYIIAGIVFLVVLFSIFIIGIHTMTNEKERLGGNLKDILAMRDEYAAITADAARLERKVGQSSQGIVPIIEDTLGTLGIKAKAIKPIDKNKVGTYTEESAELQVDGLDMNHLVNLLYRLENSPMPLKIKTASMKSSFDNPELINLTATIALITK